MPEHVEVEYFPVKRPERRARIVAEEGQRRIVCLREEMNAGTVAPNRFDAVLYQGWKIDLVYTPTRGKRQHIATNAEELRALLLAVESLDADTKRAARARWERGLADHIARSRAAVSPEEADDAEVVARQEYGDMPEEWRA